MSRALAPIAIALSLWASALIGGCASPGDPTPRHPVVPLPITDLAARQSGSEIVLTFTLPTRSTDREILSERPSIEIFRADLTPGAAPDKKTPWHLAYTIPSERVDSYTKDNHITFRDPLAPASVTRVEGAPVAYMARTRTERVRDSQNSNILSLRVFPAPAPPGETRAAVTESAIVLSWAAAPPPSGASLAGYNVYRAQLESGQESAPQDLSPTKLKSPQELIGHSTASEFRDLHFKFGESSLYTVRSVAAFGADLVESADSAPMLVTAHDVFPPAAPLALEAAVIPATGQALAYVELSWGISPELDLAGYRVYRSDQEAATGDRLNTELLPSPAFRDISVASGKRYFYRVSAVDRSGNESPASSAVLADVP
jgi:hypothetical protein